MAHASALRAGVSLVAVLCALLGAPAAATSTVPGTAVGGGTGSVMAGVQ